MIGGRILQSVFPKPRTAVRFRDVLPLVVFLLLFTTVCAGLEMSQTLLFARPAAFALLIATPWIWWMHFAGFSGLTRFRGLTALSVRLVLVGLFVILIAEPRAVRMRDVISVVYALDISDSISSETVDDALAFVAATVTEKPVDDEAGLIVFGRNSAVELPPRKQFPFEGINSRIDRDATNIEQSLSLAAAMLPEEYRGRIVLISDGIETSGNLSPILEQLNSRGIAVDIFPVPYNYEREVWLERLDLPQFVKIGENYQASIVLSSLQAGSGRLVLYENGSRIFEQAVDFRPGKNRYVVPIYVRAAGYYEYSATIEVPRETDSLPQNNTVLSYIFVEGEGKVLLVTDPKGDKRDWELLNKAILESERLVEMKSAYNFPRDPLSLMPYDCVIFANVAADAFDSVQLKALHDAVFHMGVGFLMVGGPNSFGPGGYHRTVIEDALPVTMDVRNKKILPKGALVIILHTCEFPQGNTWGKRITKQAIKVLGDRDEVGVLVYDFQNAESWLFKLTPAGDYDKLVPKINAAQIGDMPTFATTMQMGLTGLMNSDASAKHMIIISDGDPSPPPPALIKQFIQNTISVSTVAIQPHGTNVALIKKIATDTGGRFYYPKNPNLLPAIFIKESKTLKRNMIQNVTITPESGYPSAVLKGIDALPPLHGYVLTTSKARSENVLNTPVKEGSEGEGEIDPILAIGKYGLATTAAFTSDLSANWGKDWVEWDKYRAFVKQLLIEISRVRKDGHLRMWNYTSGNEGIVVIEDFHPEEAFLEIEASVSGPRERTEMMTLRQVGPRRYQGSIPLWGKGRYQIVANAAADGREDRSIGSFIVPYSPEYLRFRSNPIILDDIRKKTGGENLADLDASERANTIYGRRDPKRSSSPVFDWFLIALAFLIPVDVAVRRIQLDWYVIKQLLGLGRKQDSTITMTALLKRKQAVDSQLDAQRAEQRLAKEQAARAATTATTRKTQSPRHPAAGSEPVDEQKRQQKDKDVPPKDEDGMSMTERLLAMQRKRRDEDS